MKKYKQAHVFYGILSYFDDASLENLAIKLGPEANSAMVNHKSPFKLRNSPTYQTGLTKPLTMVNVMGMRFRPWKSA